MTVLEAADLFEDEALSRGALVHDKFMDEARLFARSVLPERVEVRKGDVMQGGAAVRVRAGSISVRPYMFRQICENGAIMSFSGDESEIDLNDRDADELVRGSLQACYSNATVSANVRLMSNSAMRPDSSIMMLSLYRRLRSIGNERAVLDVMSAFDREGDRSGFGVMNAITAVARETVDPELRWNLEELGGSVPAMDQDPLNILLDARELSIGERELALDIA